MKNLTLIELYKIRKRLLKEGLTSGGLLAEINSHILDIENKIFEDTSATGGLSIGGMGAVVSAQPSGIAGETIGMNWASGGGTTGSGDISVPYNPSGTNRMQQKVEMGRNHGARTGKKSRDKKIDVKALRAALAKRKSFSTTDNSDGERSKKVMDFNDFIKDQTNVIKK